MKRRFPLLDSSRIEAFLEVLQERGDLKNFECLPEDQQIALIQRAKYELKFRGRHAHGQKKPAARGRPPGSEK